MSSSPDRPKRRSLRPLRPLGRLAALTAGWSLVGIGILGLALPGIQGILTLVLGLAVLSLVSERAYLLLRRVFRRWPSGWKRVVRMRERVHALLTGKDR